MFSQTLDPKVNHSRDHGRCKCATEDKHVTADWKVCSAGWMLRACEMAVNGPVCRHSSAPGFIAASRNGDLDATQPHLKSQLPNSLVA